MNIRYEKKFEEKLKSKVLKITILDREKSKEIEEFVKNIDYDYDAIIDPGSFGIEPTIYIFGKDPRQIVNIVKEFFEVKE